jgi:hypothetical protein
MSAKRVLLVILVATLVVLAAGVVPRLAANSESLSPATGPEIKGSTIPYTGRLTSQEGEPVVEGDYAFAFALYDVETGGESLWSEVQGEVWVEGGAFVTALGAAVPIPPAVLEDRPAVWLAVGVRGPGEVDFTALTPRQRLIAEAASAPASTSSGQACPHDHWGEAWNGSGVGLSLSSST